jgi:hypothetical protein
MRPAGIVLVATEAGVTRKGEFCLEPDNAGLQRFGGHEDVQGASRRLAIERVTSLLSGLRVRRIRP